MLKKVLLIVLGFLLSGGMFVGNFALAGGFGDQDTSYNPNVQGSESMQQDTFLGAVQSIVNWVLSILGLIALIMLLWGGFQMVTAAGNEERYKKGFTILKQAAIGLLLIGLSWLIVSIIFWVITNQAGQSG